MIRYPKWECMPHPNPYEKGKYVVLCWLQSEPTAHTVVIQPDSTDEIFRIAARAIRPSLHRLMDEIIDVLKQIP